MSDHAKGTYFWDVDGNKYLDFMCAYGPNVLGYCDDDVDKAAMEQLKRGNCTTSPSYKMVECAELLKDTVATADWAFFMKNHFQRYVCPCSYRQKEDDVLQGILSRRFPVGTKD